MARERDKFDVVSQCGLRLQLPSMRIIQAFSN
jgi:hypothetical protein